MTFLPSLLCATLLPATLTGIQPEPHQTNLAKDPKHAAKLAEMQRINDPYRFIGQP